MAKAGDGTRRCVLLPTRTSRRVGLPPGQVLGLSPQTLGLDAMEAALDINIGE